jgi:asparagine synthase (glutamine-hydrolysing)
MCGISGMISVNNNTVSKERLKRMTDAIAHRGPDGEGQWINNTGHVGLGHRRLSIIDLTENAAQPLHYLNRYTIIHNGEIYNYIEIRNELKKLGYSFKSASDTEVIVAAYDQYKKDCLKKFDGMFAFAIWDEQEQILFAARDRFGEKPFYYHETNQEFVFASEMKALWEAGIPKDVDDKMLLNYITLGYVQNASDKELTFFNKIYCLPPAHFLTVKPQQTVSEVHSYWTLDKETKLQISETDATEKLDALFSTSVKRRIRSDVEIGTSLSGGLDSSSIVQKLSEFNLKPSTFSAVFPGFEKDESVHIQIVKENFQVQNFQSSPTALDLINDFEKLCWHQEEPFQSSSIYAQFKVFELAKKHKIKVLLDGQGADEILAGYHKYIHWYLQELLSRNKFGKAKMEKQSLQKNNARIWWGIRNIAATFLPAHASIQLEKREYTKSIHHPDINPEFIRSLRGKEWEGIHKPIVTKLNDILHFNVMENGMEELLRFADRNSMAHGTEVRLPFLSHKLVEFVFSLPAIYKIHGGFTKYLLRKMMDKKLPDSIVWRKDKIGFEPPQIQWMQHPTLVEYIHEAKKKLVTKKILQAKTLDNKIKPMEAHDTDNFDWRYLCAAQII